jgi:transposase
MEAKVVEEIGITKRKLFKTYDQGLVVRVPLIIEDMIGPSDLVRVVNNLVDGIADETLELFYTGGGSTSYHPKMMLKVILYAYCNGIYTSRKIAKEVRSNINYIWLGGGNNPCYKSLSSFRSGKLEKMIDEVFKHMLSVLIESGYVDMEKLYIDGSKWEANGNRYKCVWKKNAVRYGENTKVKIEELLTKIKELQSEEDKSYGCKDLAEVGENKELSVVLDSEIIKSGIEKMSDLVSQEVLLQNSKLKKPRKTELEKAEAELTKLRIQLSKYEEQQRIIGDDRNSYHKTDTDATMLRMKNEQLLPGYNVQHTTTNQYVVNYTITHNASDNPTLIGHLGKMDERFEGVSSTGSQVSIGADAGYGSEENYAELEKRENIAMVKPPLWYQEYTGELAKKKYNRANWPYDGESNSYTCPNNRKLNYVGDKKDVSRNGYERTVSHYICESCKDCPFAQDCKRSEEKERTVQHSTKGEAYKKKATDLLATPEGVEMRKNRSIEVETVFGDIKYNMKHSRFVLRSKEKVYIEYGLLVLAHNMRKIYCKESGVWLEYYAQRAAKKEKTSEKGA